MKSYKNINEHTLLGELNEDVSKSITSCYLLNVNPKNIYERIIQTVEENKSVKLMRKKS